MIEEGKEKRDFINRFLHLLRGKKGRDLNPLEREEAESEAEKAYHFSKAQLGEFDGD